MRQKFDAGTDPLDPEEQQNSGGRGFNPFGQGGHFTFHFGGGHGGFHDFFHDEF